MDGGQGPRCQCDPGFEAEGLSCVEVQPQCTDADCDDNQPCTDDGCSDDGTCFHASNVLLCDDGDPCTWSDACAEGSCSGIAFPCDDGLSTWDGGGVGDNWTTAENWEYDIAPVPGDRLAFSGTARLSSINDFPIDTRFASMTFITGGFTLSGSNAITLDPLGAGLTVAIDNLQGYNTIDLPLSLGSACTFAVLRAGTLELEPGAMAPLLGGGVVDIQGGKMIFAYNAASPATTIEGLLKTSYADTWTGGQFLCTTQDAMHTLGWADNGVDQVKVARTYYGDANLDGYVDGSDQNTLLSNYNQIGGMTWSQGDFTYDGTVDVNDLGRLLNAYGMGPVDPGI